MRSAVATRCGPSASTSSASGLIEVCAARLMAATTSRASLRTGAAIECSSRASSSSLTAKPSDRISSNSASSAFLLVIVLGAPLGELHLGDQPRRSPSGR